MEPFANLTLDRRPDGVVTLTLNRPERHNAFDEDLIGDITSALDRLAGDPAVRVLVLAGAGRSFSAGADLGWMQRAADFDDAANLADARRLEQMLSALDGFPRPTIAKVGGAAIGGGVGLVAACDIAIADERAVFALSEVRLGLVPAVIAPFVLRAIGERQARRYVLSAERFDARRALALGMVHDVVKGDALDAAVDAMVGCLLEGGPEAQHTAKGLLAELRHATPDTEADRTALRIAQRRASAEGREGVRAFLEKRRPHWHPGA